MSDTMNPEVKALWVTALRSGQYVQGKGALHVSDPDSDKPERWCCLGVLCDVADKAGVNVERRASAKNKRYEVFDGKADLPPDAVFDWAGLGMGREFMFDADGVCVGATLAAFNDGDARNNVALTFAQIADLIEEQA